MTLRQKALKLFYPLLMLFPKRITATAVHNKATALPQQPFGELAIQLNNGEKINTGSLKGKKILLVNTASDCGYTAQYGELQKLYQHAQQDLEVIGFPANDFKGQEQRSDEDIAKFCSANFGVSFPLAKKSSVIKGLHQNEVFRWLSDKNLNGWNDKQPEWNFSKYLVNEEGVLTHYFPPAVSPLSTEVLSAVNG